jgi:MFS transporter, MHS family, proline/betaine transporter
MAEFQMTAQAHSRTRVLVGGVAGNVLEWFDFAVYGFFAVTIGKLFFPAEDPVAQVISAFGIFAVGFLMRPVGGMVFGYIGDKFGRHNAMLISVAAMAIPTFLVGMLPTYATLGIAAPFLLLLLRMIQGLSVGGEYTTSVVYLYERTPKSSRGLVGSLSVSGAVLGILLGSAVGALLAALLDPEQLASWGWRVPFLSGLVLGLAGFWLRQGGESISAERPIVHNPLKDAWNNHRKIMLQVSGLSMVNAVVFYLVFVYVVSWLEMVDGIAPATSLEINSASLVLLIAVMILAGWLSDKIGARIILMTSVIAVFVLAWPLFWLMHSQHDLTILAGQFGYAVIIGGYLGVLPAYMVSIIPAAVRCTAAGLSYNITLGVAGGLSPMLATYLVHRTQDDLSPAYMIMLAAAISGVALLSIGKDDHKRDA